MIITEKYLIDNATKRGGYTKAQVLALGLSWPLPSGWKKKIIGTEITDSQAARFELAKTQFKAKVPANMDKIISNLPNLSDQQLFELVNAFNAEMRKRGYK